MSEYKKYREKLIQSFHTRSDHIDIELDELLQSYDQSIDEMGLKRSGEQELVDTLGTPQEYLSSYFISRSMETTKEEGPVLKRIKSLRLREARFISYPFSKQVILSVIFIPFLIQYMIFLLNFVFHTHITPLFAYLNPFGWYLSTLDYQTEPDKFMVFNRLAVFFNRLLLHIPILIELATGLSAIYILNRKNMLRLRNLFRLLFFTYELVVAVDFFMFYLSASITSLMIIGGPYLVFFELVILIRRKYFHPMDDRFVGGRFYKLYFVLITLFAIILGFWKTGLIIDILF